MKKKDPVLHRWLFSFRNRAALLLDPQEGEQGEVGLLVEAQDALPVHVVLLLLLQSVEGEERRVEARQQDGEQQSRAAHHAAETPKNKYKTS